MLATPRVREFLRKNDLSAIRSVMRPPSGIQDGMHTLDYAVHRLIQAGLIDVDTAMAAADSPNDLGMRLKELVLWKMGYRGIINRWEMSVDGGGGDDVRNALIVHDR